MRARHVREAAVGDVLQTSGDASRAVIFNVRYVDDLGQLLRDQPDHIRPRVVLAEEVRLDVDARVVALIVVPDVRAFGREDVYAFGDARRVINLIELILEPLVDVNLLRLDADLHQVTNGLRDYLARRDDPRAAAGVDLEADHVVRPEKAPPRINRLRFACQRAHPALHHFAHDFAVDLQPVFAQTFRRFDRDDFAGIRPGHSGGGGGFMRSDDLVFRGVTLRMDGRSQRGRGKELDEGSTFHRSSRFHTSISFTRIFLMS